MDNRPHIIPDFDNESMECGISPGNNAFSNISSRFAFTIPMAVAANQFLVELHRERQGRCGICGIQTHIFGRRNTAPTPLTIQNDVLQGRCLLCHPFPLAPHSGDSSASPQEPPSTTRPMTGDEEYTFSGKCHSSDLIDILHNMKQFPDDVDVQELGCETVWIHSWDDEMSKTIGNIGGITRILDTLRRYPNHYGISVTACGAIQNLASASTPSNNRQELIENGGASLIVQAMMTHPSSVSIQRSCCCALVSLLSLSSTPSSSSCGGGNKRGDDHEYYHYQVINVARGDLAIATSLGLHPGDPFIQYCASQAFQVLVQ